MNKLGFGMMRMPLLDANDPKSVDVEQVKKMVDLCFENGISYFDCATMYHAYACEAVVKEALTSRYPRESFKLANKFHTAYADTPEGMEAHFNKQLAACGVDYFDNYLIHGINMERYQLYKKLGAFEWIAEKKKEGKIRKMGFSFHAGADLLEDIFKSYPQMDFVQLQLNYMDWDSAAIQAKRCHDLAVQYGKEIIVMEPIKGGILTKLPDDAFAPLKACRPDWSQAEWALKFVANEENVSTVLSGMSSLDQMKQNIAALEGFEKLTDEESAALVRASVILKASNAIACTACAYCTPGCPQNIPIPKYFALYNAISAKGGEGSRVTTTFFYKDLSSKFGKASDCIECGQCEEICPQKLPVIDNLKKLAKEYEK